MAIDYIMAYADIETYNPSKSPEFWYGGVKYENSDEYLVFKDFESYWNELIRPVDNKRKIVVFHNALGYDAPILSALAKRDLGYLINPRDDHGKIKAGRKRIFSGNKYEVYGADGNLACFIVDSRPLISGSIKSWGKALSIKYGLELEKGETPITDVYRDPTDADIRYLKRDIQILSMACQEYHVKDSILAGKLTISSIVQGSIKDLMNPNHRDSGLKAEFGSRRKKSEDPIPKAISDEIEKQVKLYARVDHYVDPYGETLPIKINGELKAKFRRKIRSYLMGLLDPEISKIARRIKRRTATNEEIALFNGVELPQYDVQTVRDYMINDYIERDNKALISLTNDIVKHAFRGGMCWVNPEYQDKVLGAGVSCDANSMYPSVLSKYRIPRVYKGYTWGLQPNKAKFFIAEITKLKATVKPGCYAWLKRPTKDIIEAYEKELEWTGNDTRKYPRNKITTVLSSVDILWLEHTYNVEEIEYGRVLYYESDPVFTDALREHIAHWRAVKEHEKHGTPEYKYAKLMLNTLWGRWAMFEKKADVAGRATDIGDKQTDLVSAVFTTCYARVELNKMMNRFYGQVIYCDTDSVHILLKKGQTRRDIEDKLKDLDVYDDYEFNKWKIEDEWRKCKYLKAKTYVHDVTGHGELEFKSAGVPLSAIKQAQDLGVIRNINDYYVGLKLQIKKSVAIDDGRVVIQQQLHTV